VFVDAVDVGHADGGQNKGHMNDDVPHQFIVIDRLGVHEYFQQVDG